jgi:hypothetical protein
MAVDAMLLLGLFVVTLNVAPLAHRLNIEVVLGGVSLVVVVLVPTFPIAPNMPAIDAW